MSNRLPALLLASLSVLSLSGLVGCSAGEPEGASGPSESAPSSPPPAAPSVEQLSLQDNLLKMAGDRVGAPVCLSNRDCQGSASCDRSELECIKILIPGTVPGGKTGVAEQFELCLGRCRYHLPPTGPELGEPCGNHFCAVGQICCNASCGLCIEPGGLCLKQTCGIAPPTVGEWCGNQFCGEGEYCCNTSCGICAPIEGSCVQIFCETPY